MTAVKKQKPKIEPIEAEIISEEPQNKSNQSEPIYEYKYQYRGKKRGNGRVFWGLLLVMVGVMLVLSNYFEIDVWQNFWPIIIVLIGLSSIFESFETKGDM